MTLPQAEPVVDHSEQELVEREVVVLMVAEAVEAVRAAPDGFDAVLLDVIMPRMNGPEAFAIIHALVPDLPVIVTRDVA